MNSLSNILIFNSNVFLFRISGSLLETLHTCDTGDIVIVGGGTHQIKGAGNLEEGGVIRGIHHSDYTVLSTKETETSPSLLDFSGNQVSYYSNLFFVSN